MLSERGLWAWGSCGQPTGGAATHLVGYSSVLDFLWLVLSRKWRQKLGKLAGIGQVLAVWGWLSSVGISSSSVCVCVCAFSVVSDSLRPSRLWPSRLLCPWNFPGKNTRVGWLPVFPPGDLPHPGIEPASLASSSLAGGFFTTAAPGKPASSHGPSIFSLSVFF